MEGNEGLGADDVCRGSQRHHPRRVYEKVNPEGHEKVLLDDIRGLQAKAA